MNGYINDFVAAFVVESRKALRSKVSWLTALAFSLIPAVGGLIMVILRDPELARRSNLLSTKAQAISATADWPTYLGLLTQAIAVGGFVVFGLVALWVFGREYSDRTMRDLLALPIDRAAIVAAKFVVIALWCLALTALNYPLGLGVGAAIALPGGTPDIPLRMAGQYLAMAGLTVLLVTPVAWAACAGRGYLSAFGALLLLFALAQIIAVAGWGAYFPWSVPALASGAAGPGAAQLGVGSYLLVVVAGIAGIAATLAWWRYADHQ